MRQFRQRHVQNKKSKIVESFKLNNQINNININSINNSLSKPFYTKKSVKQQKNCNYVFPVTLSPLRKKKICFEDSPSQKYGKWSVHKIENHSLIDYEGFYSFSPQHNHQFDDRKLRSESLQKKLNQTIFDKIAIIKKSSVLMESGKEQIFLRYCNERKRQSPRALQIKQRRSPLNNGQIKQSYSLVKKKLSISGWQQFDYDNQ